MNAAFWLTLAIAQPVAAPAVTTAPPQEIAPGVELLRGAILPERGPDGNTVVLDAPDGLIVVDTGRHAWHSDAILAYAKSEGRPIAAILNTHWHLDHTSGNGRIKSAFPKAPVFATSAVERALAPGGFLPRNLESSRAMLDDPKVPEIQKEEIRIFHATMAERGVLRPDVVVTESGARTIAGRPLDLGVTDGAVTDADLWLYDGATGVAVIGDLVTFPAPFFETACPAAWRQALDDVWAVPFKTAIPGHGEPMSRAQFDAWRGAFNRFMDCVEGTQEAGQCAAAWADGIASFNGSDERARKQSLGYAEYYVGFLRENGGKSPDCRRPRT
jgi:glyoxylase-like metal-dependent hydrolase (beta-lactamase superfamily II)